MHTWISQRFLAKKICFKNNCTRINHYKFIHHKSYLKPFLSYLPCIVCREYFSIIFNVKKCELYSIKYSICWNIFLLSWKLPIPNSINDLYYYFVRIDSLLLIRFPKFWAQCYNTPNCFTYYNKLSCFPWQPPQPRLVCG